MSTHYALWRLNRLTTTDIVDPQRLAEGLRLHLQHADLVTVLVQIEAEQRAYVGLHGCSSCVQGRCRPGCRTELLRRLLRACAPNAQLQPVPGGLAHRPYSAAYLAWPTKAAQLPDAPWLAPWPEARLELAYCAGRVPRVTLLLAVGSSEPAHAVLKKHGWMSIRLPDYLGSRVTGAYPHRPGGGWLLQTTPGLLLPTPGVSGSSILSAMINNLRSELRSEVVPLSTLAAVLIEASCSTRLERHVEALLAGETPFRRRPATEHSIAQEAPSAASEAESQSPFPPGPGTGKSAMSPQAVAAWVEGMLAAPQAHTRKTIAGLLPEPYKEHATTLLLWLDAAGVLEAAPDPAQPYRHPRALCLHDPAVIAERLCMAALPVAAQKGDEP